jgi:GNAT superfamily N-acetyltransferase
MFVALADGEVIGCAGLLPDPDHPRRAEHALTAVRRDWRRRGVATALKRSTLAWAAGHGFTEVYTEVPLCDPRAWLLTWGLWVVLGGLLTTRCRGGG